MAEQAITPVTALILAGGRSRRMGGEDKGLIVWRQIPLFQHVIHRLQAQLQSIVISANRNQEQYAACGLPVIEDEIDGFQGPLAGILTGLHYINEGYLLVVPVDAPCLPLDLLARLSQTLAANPQYAALAHDGERLQPLFALIPKAMQGSLSNYLQHGNNKVSDWFLEENTKIVHFDEETSAFYNANSPEDFSRLADSE